jgi:hypothetical protein
MNKFEILGVLSHVKFRDWVFAVGEDQDRLYLQVCFSEICLASRRGPRLLQKGRKYFLSEHMSKSEIVQTALTATLAATEHEAREAFTYKGQAIFGPHWNVDRLVELALQRDSLGARQ